MLFVEGRQASLKTNTQSSTWTRMFLGLKNAQIFNVGPIKPCQQLHFWKLQVIVNHLEILTKKMLLSNSNSVLQSPIILDFKGRK